MRNVITGEGVELELPAASLITRAASLIVDLLVSWIALITFVLLSGMTAGAMSDPAMDAAITLGGAILCLVILPMTVETLSRGRSVGRLIFGTRVVRDDGGAIRFRHAAIRALVGFGEIYLSLGMIPLFTGMFSRRTKRLGDMVAGTYVIRVRQPAVKPMMLPVPPQLTSWTQIADLGWIPDPVAARASRFLRTVQDTSKGQNTQALEHTANRIANEVAGSVAPPAPSSTATEFLVAVMAERRNREYRRLRIQADRQARLGQRLHKLPYA